jgi:hypothetical protein
MKKWGQTPFKRTGRTGDRPRFFAAGDRWLINLIGDIGLKGAEA